MKELEQDGLAVEINKKFIDLSKLPDHQGFVHWNINNLCWIEEKSNINDYGIAFNTDENLLGVLNKKKASYGNLVKGKLYTNPENEKTSLFITEVLKEHNPLLIAVYREFNSWNILNNGAGFKFKKSEADITSEVKDGDIFVFRKNGTQYVEQEKFGNISEKGIEGKLIQAVAHIFKNNEPLNEITVQPLKPLNKPFFSVDGIGTKDIDDTIWIEKKPLNAGYDLWVAISDVSSFVKPNDNQDIHAKDKSTSFYFNNDTTHMLSRGLAENFCSLNPGLPKLALICHLEYDNNGKLISSEFLNNEIISHARLTYDDVNLILEDKNPQNSLIYKDNVVSKWNDLNEPGTKWLSSTIKVFEEFSLLLSKEYNPNYWIVPSVDLSINEFGKIDHLYIDGRDGSPAQKIVETSMLAANKAAAQFLSENYPFIGLFRNQVAPSKEFERPKPAFYDTDNEGHWGLQTEFYTHFTSPIRRYCDLITNRLIKDVLYSKTSIYTKDDIDEIAKRINFQQYVSRQCSNREKNLLTSQYLQSLVETGSLQIKNKIVDVNENGIVVRNNQLLENYIPKFKLDREIVASIESFDHKNLNPIVKENLIEELNNTWKIKCFIDNYHWLDSRKEITNKFYKRDVTDELNSERKNNAKI